MTLVVAAAAVLGAAALGALPCDIFATHGTPCVAAHSVVRAMYADYDGPLYQVVRTADGESTSMPSSSLNLRAPSQLIGRRYTC